MWSKSVTFHIPKAGCSSLVGTRCVYTKRCSILHRTLSSLSMAQGPENVIDCLTKGVLRSAKVFGWRCGARHYTCILKQGNHVIEHLLMKIQDHSLIKFSKVLCIPRMWQLLSFQLLQMIRPKSSAICHSVGSFPVRCELFLS